MYVCKEIKTYAENRVKINSNSYVSVTNFHFVFAMKMLFISQGNLKDIYVTNRFFQNNGRPQNMLEMTQVPTWMI